MDRATVLKDYIHKMVAAGHPEAIVLLGRKQSTLRMTIATLIS